VSASGADDTRGCIAFSVLRIGMVECGETTASIHLSSHASVKMTWREDNGTNLCLVGETTKVLTIRVPCDKICKSWTQFRIFLVARDLPPFEAEASINAECLIVEVPRTRHFRGKPDSEHKHTYAVSLPTDFQLEGKLTEGIGHAGQNTASSPGLVPSIPLASYERPPLFNILRCRHMRNVRRNALYRSFKNVS
jgi:hypothetical protein